MYFSYLDRPYRRLKYNVYNFSKLKAVNQIMWYGFIINIIIKVTYLLLLLLNIYIIIFIIIIIIKAMYTY